MIYILSLSILILLYFENKIMKDPKDVTSLQTLNIEA